MQGHQGEETPLVETAQQVPSPLRVSHPGVLPGLCAWTRARSTITLVRGPRSKWPQHHPAEGIWELQEPLGGGQCPGQPGAEPRGRWAEPGQTHAVHARFQAVGRSGNPATDKPMPIVGGGLERPQDSKLRTPEPLTVRLSFSTVYAKQ